MHIQEHISKFYFEKIQLSNVIAFLPVKCHQDVSERIQLCTLFFRLK